MQNYKLYANLQSSPAKLQRIRHPESNEGFDDFETVGSGIQILHFTSFRSE